MKWMDSAPARRNQGGRIPLSAAATLLSVVILIAGLAACANPAAEVAEATAPEEEAAEEAGQDPPAEEEPAPDPLSAPEFDPAGGDFDTAPEVALSVDNTDAVIRYTLDGTSPTEQSSAYTEPIRLEPSRQPTVITARTFAEGAEASPATTQEYRVARGPILDLQIDGNGAVTAQPDEAAYLWDEEVTLAAVPGVGARFLEWTGAVAGTETNATLVMDTDKSVTAHFAPLEPPQGLTHSLRGGIVVNEILPDPTGSTSSIDTDGSGSAEDSDEFIELYNAGTAPIDVAGLAVWDAGYGNWFTFPPDSVVNAGGTALLVAGVQTGGALPPAADGSLAFDAGRGGSVMNNGSDNIVIFDPQTGSYLHLTYNGDNADAPHADYDSFPADATVVDGVEDWGSDVDGVSLGRFPDGTGAPAVHNDGRVEEATPGAPNAGQ